MQSIRPVCAALFNASNEKSIRGVRRQESDAYVSIEKEERERDGMNGKKKRWSPLHCKKRKHD